MVLRLLHLLLLLRPCSPLSCLHPCAEGQESTEERPCTSCPEVAPSSCSSGEVVVGACGCEECAGGAGAECGGPWDTLGQCAGGLLCATPPHQVLPSFSTIRRKIATKLLYKKKM